MEVAVKKKICGNLGTTTARSKAVCHGWVKPGERRKDERF